MRLDVVGGDELGRGDRPIRSWRLPEGAAVRHGYRIRTEDGHDTGTVQSEVQSFVDVRAADPWHHWLAEQRS